MSQSQKKIRYRVTIEMVEAFAAYIRYGAEDLPFNLPDLLDFINFGKPYSPQEAELLVKGRSMMKDVMSAEMGSPEEYVITRNRIPQRGFYGQPFAASPLEFPQFEITGKVQYTSFGTAYHFAAVDYYELPAMRHATELWYMELLRDRGIRAVEFIIQSQRQNCIFVETYNTGNTTLDRLYENLNLFQQMLEEQRSNIKNTSIFL